MGGLWGFLRDERVDFAKRPVRERLRDHRRYFSTQPEEELARQGGRCMDCGIPFCHEGCPLGNLIPDWNELVSRGDWRHAIEALHATNNFPEFTGLVCPAPCESACVLAIGSEPVTIKQVELGIIERAFAEGWVTARPPRRRTGRHVAVVGSGPAGLACAQELNWAGHRVTVFERDEAPGGLLRFGVPDAKLEKWVIDRRLALMEDEGIEFRCGEGVTSPGALLRRHDALVLAIGSRAQRDVALPGRSLRGVHLAMDYLYQRNRQAAREDGHPAPLPSDPISARRRRVVVIGGGDTGMDCASWALREGARRVTLLDVYPELPASGRPPEAPWPLPPKRTLSTYALEEGALRRWGAEVVAIQEGRRGQARSVLARRVEGTSSADMRAVPGSEHEVRADLVLVAIGFSHPEHEGLVAGLGVALGAHGNIRAPAYETSVPGVFACGDARTGQSLVVSAIAEGRRCARMASRALGGPAQEPEPEAEGPLALAAREAGTVVASEALYPSAA
jgi:glutamate synthase (NADPH/NADH) small chain